MIFFVTVVFNDTQGLVKTIRSLEYAHHIGVTFTHIIIDGESTDGTKEFVECLDLPYELVCLSEPDCGIYDAMNKGLERCHNGYVNFLNAGDVLCFDGIDWNQFAMDLLASDFEIVACGYIFRDIKSRTKYIAPRTITRLYPGMPSSHQAIFFDVKTIKMARFNIAFQICGDFDLIMRMICNGARISLNDSPTVIFNSGGLSFQKPFVLFFESMAVSTKSCACKLILPIKALQLSFSLLLVHIRRWV